MPLSRRQLLAGTAAISAASAIPLAANAISRAPDLRGRKILITGSSSGFGRIGAEYYARLGATVHATMRNTPRPEAEELIALAARDKLDIRVSRLDVRNAHEIAGMVDLVSRSGGLDVLINNAGIGITGPVELQDDQAMHDAFDTNVFGYHRVTRAFLPMMRAASSGMIFFVSSQLGRVIAPASGLYSPCKFAVEAMAEQLAYELEPKGIDVTIIQPGGYPTEIWRNRNVYTGALKERADEERKLAYPAIVAAMGNEDGSGRSADPMDVPRAIARIIAMPPGTRPLREAVHPGNKPQLAINKISAETQVGWLGRSGRWGDSVRAVHSG